MTFIYILALIGFLVIVGTAIDYFAQSKAEKMIEIRKEIIKQEKDNLSSFSTDTWDPKLEEFIGEKGILIGLEGHQLKLFVNKIKLTTTEKEVLLDYNKLNESRSKIVDMFRERDAMINKDFIVSKDIDTEPYLLHLDELSWLEYIEDQDISREDFIHSFTLEHCHFVLNRYGKEIFKSELDKSKAKLNILIDEYTSQMETEANIEFLSCFVLVDLMNFNDALEYSMFIESQEVSYEEVRLFDIAYIIYENIENLNDSYPNLPEIFDEM